MAFSSTRVSFFILISSALFTLASCQEVIPSTKAKQSDVAVFIDNVKKNSAHNALEKTTASEGRNETSRLLTPNMEHELSFFSKAILAEPFIKGYYTASSRQADGLTVSVYTAIGEKPEVRTLEVFRNADGMITAIRMETLQNNYLFQNSLQGELVADIRDGNPVFKTYKVEGKQKMLFGEPYQFDISAKAL